MNDAITENRIAIAAKPHELSIRKYSITQLALSMTTEAALLLREIAPCFSQSISNFPKRGCSYIQRCRRSEPFAENHATNSKNGTVGIPGKNTPTIAKARNT